MNISSSHEYTYRTSQPGHHHQYLAQPVLSLIQTMIPPSPAVADSSGGVKPRILDLGCGNGSFSSFLANQGFEVIGIEESSSGISHAQQNYSNCQFRQGSIYDLILTDLSNSFDIVLAMEVIEHLFYPRQLIQVAKQCLRPHGVLILTTPYHGYLKNLALSLTGKMDAHFTALWDGGHIKFFSVATLSQLLTSEGFVEQQFKFTGRVPYLWKSMICAAKLS